MQFKSSSKNKRHLLPRVGCCDNGAREEDGEEIVKFDKVKKIRGMKLLLKDLQL
jgi:hypothetical protein